MSSSEEEDVETNQMIWQKHAYDHCSQLHAPSKNDETIDMHNVYVNNFFLFLLYFDKDETFPRTK